MQYTQHTDQRIRKQARRAGLFLLAGLLSWSEVGYSGGPIFEDEVWSRGEVPAFRFIDTGEDEPDWGIYVDSSKAPDAFSIQWKEATRRSIPFVIENGAGGDAFYINADRNLGLGTNFPEEAVDVLRQEAATRFQLTSVSNAPSDAPQFIQRRSRGEGIYASEGVHNGDNLGLFSFRGGLPNGSFSGSQATITAQATQTWTTSARGTRLLFGTTENGTSTMVTAMEITHDGRVLINGLELNVPDYVFADDYKLMPLDELKAYIATHKHLPEVASEAEVKRDGVVDLGGTQMTLLKKVEELTLYTIQQHEKLQALQEQLVQKEAELEEKEAKLAQRVAALEQQLQP